MNTDPNLLYDAEVWVAELCWVQVWCYWVKARGFNSTYSIIPLSQTHTALYISG